MKLIVICLLLICGCSVKLEVKPQHSSYYCIDECKKYLYAAEILFRTGDYTCIDDPRSICLLDCMNKPQYIVLTKDVLGMPLTGYVDTTYCWQNVTDEDDIVPWYLDD